MPAALAYDFCPDCAAKVRQSMQPPDNKAFLQGLIFGSGAALLCGIGYAILLLTTGWQIGLVAILVGYLVGRAVRMGAGGRGGRRCQIAAVTLTYLAMTLSYAPVIVKQLRDGKAKEQTTTSSEQQAKQPTILEGRQLGIGQYALGLGLLGGISLVSPFLDLLSGFSGILGLAIIFFGLQRAWVLTAGDSRTLSGPFSLGSDSAPTTLGDPQFV
ncbi:MAG: hypothetical protein ABI824_12905 [Acidobacteriota bacterium]